MNADALAARALTMRIALSDTELDRLAELLRCILQKKARAAGVLLTAHTACAYMDLPEDERAAHRSAIADVIRALVLLGWIDLA